LLFADPEIAMVFEKALYRKTLTDDDMRYGAAEHRYPLLPRRARGGRLSRSVDRESTTETGVNYSSTELRSEYPSTAVTRPLLQRRYSLSAITAKSVIGAEDNAQFLDTECEFYGTRPKGASHVRWSRKDVVYTAENMGFSLLRASRHTGHTMSTHSSPGYVSNLSDTNVDSKQLRSRTASVTRFVDACGHFSDHTEDGRRRGQLRASSMPRIDNGVTRSAHFVGNKPIARRRANSVARSYRAGFDRSRPSYSWKTYGAPAEMHSEDNDGFDIASFVLSPGEQFIPTDISVSILPSGKKAITYTRFSQKGTGDQHKANVEIDHIIQRTNRFQVIFQTSIIVSIRKL